MSRRLACLACLVLLAASVEAQAQIKPATSGKQSFDEPEMRQGREGLVHPNRPHRHHHDHHRRGLFR